MNAPTHDALDALNALDPGMPREQWVRACFGFKDAGGTENEWLDWCERGPNYNRADAISTYRNAKPRAGGVTAASLFGMAHDAGWRPARGNNGQGGAMQAPRPTPARAPREPEPEPTDPVPVWNACHAVVGHPYLTRKGVKPHGCRVNSVGALVVPYYNAARELQTIQTVAPDGSKRFLTGGKQRGSVAILGEPQGAGTVVVAEGFATAAALFEATGFPALAAGMRGTMPKAASIARQFAPNARVVLAADRGDMSTPLAAARAVGGFLAVPGPEDAPDGFDFCDWRVSGTSDAEILARIEHARPVEPEASPASDTVHEEPPPDVLSAAREALRIEGPPAKGRRGEIGVYLVDGKGRILPNLSNVFACLNTGKLGEIKIDTFTGLATWRGMPIDDDTYSTITREVQHAVVNVAAMPFIKVSTNLVAEAVNNVANANAFNSCTDWLDLVTWDGVERIASFFVDACGVQASDYHHGVGRYFWLGMVARMVHPGTKVDSAVALVGAQGIGKSSLVQLIGGERYGEVGLATIGEKDWLEQLRGKIIVEIAELAGAQRAELEQVKAIMSRTHDEYRRAYARTSHTVPRGCVFMATTNESDFLLDGSGNRRWLPVECVGAINLEHVRTMREQLFAEAYACVCAGLPVLWHVVPDALDAQARHLARDPWIDALDSAIRMIDNRLPDKVSNVALYDALKIPAERRTGGGTGRRLASAMRALGYRRSDWLADARHVRGFVLDPE